VSARLLRSDAAAEASAGRRAHVEDQAGLPSEAASSASLTFIAAGRRRAAAQAKYRESHKEHLNAKLRLERADKKVAGYFAEALKLQRQLPTDEPTTIQVRRRVKLQTLNMLCVCGSCAGAAAYTRTSWLCVHVL
jgi:ferric-dicitrate binding protein FerR (iron transport regulator)